MDKNQELEWLEAQKIVISEDLVDTAKKQLQFLSVVDRHRCLYDGTVLHRAIYRYKTYWLPLLAKHTKSKISEGPLVVPLDCEWIWHCHRLNPLRYKADCEEFYGQILNNKNVLSSVQGESKSQTEEIWKRLYPEESYELDLNSPSSDNISGDLLETPEGIKYDLVSAVKRQIPFFYQVSKPAMNSDLFLEEAVARYKGFLHMIKRNKERSVKRFCVPTYDIDLIWHSHQLNPVSYCKDLIEVLGKVLEHDDTDSDRTKGQKLDLGFSGTTMQWEETFGTRYWRAGGMYRGAAPSPVTAIPLFSNFQSKNVLPSTESKEVLQLSKTEVVEVFLEIVAVKNLPEGHNGGLFVFFSKKKPDAFLDERRRLTISPKSRQKQVASFQCEPNGELFFELMSESPSTLGISRPPKTMGTTSISLYNMLNPISKLSIEKWFELVPCSPEVDSIPICLRIAVSVTTPAPAPHVLHMVRSHPVLRSTCFFPLPQHAKGQTYVIDEADNEIINLQMRESKRTVEGKNSTPEREVIGIVGWSSETHVLAKFTEIGWSLMDSHWTSQLQKKPKEDGHIFELRGNRVVQLFPGKKLDYEFRNCQRQKNKYDFVTAVEFSNENPYGKAIALLNLKRGVLEVKEEWFVLSGITVAFILSDLLRKEGNNVFTANEKNAKKVGSIKDVYGCDVEERNIEKALLKEEEVAEKVSVVVAEQGQKGEYGGIVKNDASGGCGGSCSGNCGTMVKTAEYGGQKGEYGGIVKNDASGGCGGSCSGNCGTMVKSAEYGGQKGEYGGIVKNDVSGGCGGSCSGNCGTMVKSEALVASLENTMANTGGGGGCGSGCGGGCGGGNMVKSSGCGSGCGGGCGGGNMVKSSGCGSGCGGGCGGGNMVESNSSGGCGGGNMVESNGSGGCGGGCSGGCGGGDIVKSSGCGSGCGGGCGGGNMVEGNGSGGCGGGCSGGCGGGDMVKSSGCGSGCGGGCGGGNMVESNGSGGCGGGCSGGCGGGDMVKSSGCGSGCGGGCGSGGRGAALTAS